MRGHFDREQALRWDRDIVSYVESNGFFENYRGPGDDFFGSVGSRPEIYPIYWSPAQMQARQSDRMARVQAFPQRPVEARVRGRAVVRPGPGLAVPGPHPPPPAGRHSAGLGTHLDPGTLDLWMTEAYQKAFRHLFDGTVEQYDPWDAAYRTAGPQYPGTTMCSAFRTFQGWTALSDMAHDQGVLHTVPIPGAMAYLMLRPLLADVPDDDMCGVTVNQVFPASDTWHPLLMQALSGIPDVRAGDSVWWHCDMIHSVAPGRRTSRAGATSCTSPPPPGAPATSGTPPACGKPSVTGSSPGDFPAEHYERTWTNRFQASDLNAHRPARPRPGLSTETTS